LKKRAVQVLKLIVPLAILVWLVSDIVYQQPETAGQATAYEQIRDSSKNWGMLASALGFALAAVSVTFYRWYLLVRALELPFRVRDAFRLGFLGFLLNFVSIGSVGGDLFKAIFIAREQTRRRAEAVATVVVDRMIGLYALLVVTSIAIVVWFAVDGPDPSPEVKTICHVTFVLTALGGLGIVAVLIPGLTSGRISDFLSSLPKIGPALKRVITGIRMYRRKPGVLAVISVMSLGVHCLFAMSVYLICAGLFGKEQTPSAAAHLIISPLSMVMAALPISPAGLGVLEAIMAFLYQEVSQEQVSRQQGAVVALGFRLITIIVAAIGMVYYWTSRKEVVEILHEVEEEEEHLKNDEAGMRNEEGE